MKDRSGAFLPIFALVVAVLLVSVGMGLDYARALNDRGKGQAVADAMVLAMAHELRLGASEEVAREAGQRIYDAYYGGGSDAASLEIEELDNLRGFDLRVAFPGSTETTLMKLARFDQVPWQVNAASRVGTANIEMALVIDVSHSMLDKPGKQKMTEMRKALKQLVGAVLPDGYEATDRVVSLIPYADSVNLSGLYKAETDVYTLYIPPNKIGEKNNTPPKTEIRISKADTTCARPQEIEKRIKNEAVRISSLEPFSPSTNQGYPLCPPDSSAVLLFESNAAKLERVIEGLGHGWGTGTDVGLSWGWRALSPAWRTSFQGQTRYPRDFSNTALKMLVILTDGHSIRYDVIGDGLFKTDGSIGGVAEPNNEPDRFAWATEELRKTCDAIEAEGEIMLFTIGYDMETPTGDVPRQNAMKVLKECPANGGKHYDAEFGGLVNIINQLIAEFNLVRLYE